MKNTPYIHTDNSANTISECVFCHGTGIAKCVDFANLKHLPNGSYDLNELMYKHGEYVECIEGCQILN